jgi:hypothetical protein
LEIGKLIVKIINKVNISDMLILIGYFHSRVGNVQTEKKILANTEKILEIEMERNEYERVFKSFRTGRLERELQMVQLSATRCSCITIL